MPVPFGVSVGDFIAGIELLIEGVKSLSDTNGAQADYKKLWCELNNLKKGLECIQSLSLDPTQPAQVSAVNSAVNDCLSCVDAFVNRNSKYSALNSTPAKIWSLAGLKESRADGAVGALEESRRSEVPDSSPTAR